MPATKIACPQCSTTLRVGPDADGRRFRCPHCDSVFAAPATKDSVPAAIPLTKSNPRLVMMLGILALLMVLLVGGLGLAGGVGLMLLMGRHEAPSVAAIQLPPEPTRQTQIPPVPPEAKPAPPDPKPAAPDPKPAPKAPVPDLQPAPMPKPPPSDPPQPAKDMTPPLQKLLIGEWELKMGEDTIRMAFDKDGSFTITGPTEKLDEDTNQVQKFDLRLHGEYRFRSADVVELEIKGLGRKEGAGTVGDSKIAFPDPNQLVLTNTKSGVVTKLTRIKR